MNALPAEGVTKSHVKFWAVNRPGTMTGVSFTQLRAGDKDGSLSWLWQLLNV